MSECLWRWRKRYGLDRTRLAALTSGALTCVWGHLYSVALYPGLRPAPGHLHRVLIEDLKPQTWRSWDCGEKQGTGQRAAAAAAAGIDVFANSQHFRWSLTRSLLELQTRHTRLYDWTQRDADQRHDVRTTSEQQHRPTVKHTQQGGKRLFGGAQSVRKQKKRPQNN